MKGICFTEYNHYATIKGLKTQTRREPRIDPAPPKYKTGDILYLKEPYAQECRQVSLTEREATGKILYRFDGDILSCDDPLSPFGRWQNKLFMPARFARYFIEIADTRVERLQDISNEDCIKEGIFKHISHARQYWKFSGSGDMYYPTPRHAFMAEIYEIYGAKVWGDNPYVSVYDYKLIKEQ